MPITQNPENLTEWEHGSCYGTESYTCTDADENVTVSVSKHVLADEWTWSVEAFISDRNIADTVAYGRTGTPEAGMTAAATAASAALRKFAGRFQ